MLAWSYRLAGAASIALLAIAAARPAAAQMVPDSATAAIIAAREKQQITLPVEALEPLVGEYQLSPMGGAMTIVVTREGTQLYEQATQQPRFEIFPLSPMEFFLKVVDARITFTRDSAGKVTGLVVHQGGQDFAGPKAK